MMFSVCRQWIGQRTGTKPCSSRSIRFIKQVSLCQMTQNSINLLLFDVILMGCPSQSCSGVQSFVSLDDYIGFCWTKYAQESQSQDSLEEEELREASNKYTLFWGICSISVGLTDSAQGLFVHNCSGTFCYSTHSHQRVPLECLSDGSHPRSIFIIALHCRKTVWRRNGRIPRLNDCSFL